MLATSLTAALDGIEARLVRVEADTSAGFPKFTMLGLADSCIRESEGRIRAALRNCGYSFKWDRRITVNLAPAHLRKTGSSFDLATAVGLLAADGSLDAARLRDIMLIGELALDGELRPTTGILPMVLAARRSGLRAAVVPQKNLREARLVPGLDVYPARSLQDAVEIAAAESRPRPQPAPVETAQAEPPPDMADVRGQPVARRALEIAAAGAHNLLLVGPPGAGKTMLARRLPGLLPPLTPDEAVETSSIHSAWGHRLDTLLQDRPFRSPHHTATQAALVGGGQTPRPGDVSLAHNGVLFLDELPEFRRSSLEALREPLEDGVVTIARARGSLRLPARFQLVAAMNPCGCGFLGDARRGCRCSARQLEIHRSRISGPLLDRIDLRVRVPAVAFGDIAGPPGEASHAIRGRVLRARERQTARCGRANVGLAPRELREFACLDGPAQRLLERAMGQLGLSARGHDRLLRVARTLADLGGCSAIGVVHVAEALQFRTEEYGAA